jgi:energy-coupling factor transporter ATP-binding protein EcfA2
MSNPRDWFRRRRHDHIDIQLPEADDPFADGPVLDLGRHGRVLRDASEPVLDLIDTAPRNGGGTDTHAAAAASQMLGSRRSGPAGVHVPPPPPRPAGMAPRDGRVIEPSAFTVRPEIAITVDRRPAAATTAVGAEPSRPSPDLRPRLRIAPESVAPAEGGGAAMREPEPRDATGAAASFALRRRALPFTRPAAGGDGNPGAAPKPASAGAAEAPRRSEAAETPAETPRFTMAAPGSAWTRSSIGGGAATDPGAMNAVLRDAFTPTRPQRQADKFSGRYAQMQRIIAAIEEERAHVVLYGERGSGKTSLANIVAQKASDAGYFVLRSACSSELDFDDLFRGFLRKIPANFLADGIGASSRLGIENFEQLLPAGEIGVPELIQIFERIHDRHVILVIDEYDRVTSEDTKNKLAELIKNMSDASAPVTLLLIGVAENVDELLGKHPSLQRTLVTMPLPLMSRREIDGIIAAGEEKSRLRFDPAVRDAIVHFAQGLPYHAQLLCLFAARSAVRRNSQRVERGDLRYAVQRAAEEAEGKIKEAYNLALGIQGTSAAFRDVLFAAANAESDPFGTFTAADVAAAAARMGDQPLTLLSLQYPLKKLTDPDRGAMLRRIPTPDGLRYQFFNQMMRHYVLIRQSLERGLV